MSLEQALQDNTAAVKALTTAMTTGTNKPMDFSKPTSTPPGRPALKAGSAATKPVGGPVKANSPATPPATPRVLAKEEMTAFMSKHGTPATAALLQKFNPEAKNLSGLDDAQIDMFRAALANYGDGEADLTG